MQKSDKISNSQAVFLLVIGVLPTSLMSLPSITAGAAGTDSWISVIIAALVGIVIISVVVTLGKKFPGKTIVEYGEIIAGKFIGKIVGFIFFWFFLYLTAITTREFASMTLATTLPEVPLEVLVITFLFLVVYTVNIGLEVIARATVVVFFVITFSVIAITLLSVGDMDFTNILPVLSKGFIPPLKGALSPSGWIGETVCLGFLLPYMNKAEKGMKVGITAVSILVGFFLVADILSIVVFGAAQTAAMQFPTYMISQYISVQSVIERTEIINTIVLLVGSFAKLSLYLYVTVLACTQWLGLKDYRSITFPMGIIVGALSIVAFKSSPELSNFLTKVWGPYSLSIELGIPFLLLLATGYKKITE